MPNINSIEFNPSLKLITNSNNIMTIQNPTDGEYGNCRRRIKR
jgi:hypothetical protein